MTPAIIIPAYQPDEKMLTLVRGLRDQNTEQLIIVIDDGSADKYHAIFDELKKYNVVQLRNAENCGKGFSLKKAFRYCLDHFKDRSLVGVITVDADGQHSLEDIRRIQEVMIKKPNELHIGARDFQKNNIPLRSRFGNKLTSFICNKLLRLKVKDTQSGLRGIPYSFLEDCEQIEGNRYEFEFEMLMLAKKLKYQVNEIPIQTIYIEENASSHFRPFVDSLRIYFVFFRFVSISLLSAVIDYLLFIASFHITKNILMSIIFARVISGAINFSFNKSFSFKDQNGFSKAGIKYISLALFLTAASYLGIRLLSQHGVNIYLSKALIETFLYLISFSTQRIFVFNSQKLAQ